MKFFTFLTMALSFLIGSCTLEKTDYEAEINTAVPEYSDFKTVTSIDSGVYKIDIEALNGTFYKGYNEIRIRILHTKNKEVVSLSNVTFLPVLTQAQGNRITCPHSNQFVADSSGQYYTGYSVFTEESMDHSWKIHIDFTDNTQIFSVAQEVSVEKQVNKNLNMVAFTGLDHKTYVIALKAPLKPKVAENHLIAGIYSSEPVNGNALANAIPYTEAANYTLLLDPRMPEPSMGNHSSPNNQHLKQEADGFYHGIVNYTMTGNWTLNFILINANGKIIKGTEVPKDFTPGISGVKSELFIDILF